MSTPVAMSEELAIAQRPKGQWAWRSALALTLGVAAVAATAAAAVAAGGSLGGGEQPWSEAAVPFTDQRRLQPASPNRTDVAGAASAAGVGQEVACLTAAPGEVCHRLVQWVMEDGLLLHPEKYAGLTRSSSFEDVQMVLHRTDPDYCPRPCESKQPVPSVNRVAQEPAVSKDKQNVTNSTLWALGGCNYGHSQQKPAHAGCFITRGGKMLAIRLTYDGNRFDIPGGQTNWREPARCTAHREALEETGYLVAPRELLAVVRNDFHIYRCHLVKHSPIRGHDHEVSWVGWLNRDQVRAKASQGRFRFPEAHRYADWLL